MLAATRIVISLLKLRIGMAIAASTLAGLAATRGPSASAGEIAALTLAVLGAAGAAGAFNHYWSATSTAPWRAPARAPSPARPEAGPGVAVTFAALLAASILLAWAASGRMAALYVFLGAVTYSVVTPYG